MRLAAVGWSTPNIVVGLGIYSRLNEPCIRERYTAWKFLVTWLKLQPACFKNPSKWPRFARADHLQMFTRLTEARSRVNNNDLGNNQNQSLIVTQTSDFQGKVHPIVDPGAESNKGTTGLWHPVPPNPAPHGGSALSWHCMAGWSIYVF